MRARGAVRRRGRRHRAEYRPHQHRARHRAGRARGGRRRHDLRAVVSPTCVAPGRADHRGHTRDRRRALRHGAAGAARR